MAASAFGYALFWRAAKGNFWVGTVWFSAVQAVQLSWLSSTHYMGPLILVVYVLVAVALGLQFGLLTSFIKQPLKWRQIFALSGFWVFMEWIRLFFMSGFTWNPIGLSLAANGYSIQFSSLFGIYGLCFWIIFTNLAALKSSRIWVVLALIPYVFGFCNQAFWEQRAKSEKPMSIALVQTALSPEQRDLTRGKKQHHVHPLHQWERVLSFFKNIGRDQYDLIIFPEGAFPGGARNSIYPTHLVRSIWSEFPEVKDSYVTNSHWLQSLSNHFGADVIAGLDDGTKGAMYNAAFHFKPGSSEPARYEKQVLVPVGEYIPLSFLSQFLSREYGITGSFNTGVETKVFQGKLPVGISICLEETYGELVRDARKNGAKLLVNITNDSWFPETRLPWHHFDHGRLRAAENGVYLLRSCNTGVTAVINCFGQTEAIFPGSETVGGILSAEIKPRAYPTLYTAFGDAPILFLSLLAIGVYLIEFWVVSGLIRVIVKKKLLEYGLLG